MINYENLYSKDYFSKYGLNSNSPENLKRLEMYRLERKRIFNYCTGGIVLDIGCGTGEFLSGFDSEKWVKFGIEPASSAREFAEVNYGIEFNLEKISERGLDLIIFRGVFQHLDEPLHTIKKYLEILNEGGLIVFLATPNTASLVYRISQDLPALDPSRNFCLTSAAMLKNILQNFGLAVEHIEYPYLNSPYRNLITDHINFALMCLGIKRKFAFWRNMFEVYARKVGKDEE